MTQAPLVVVAAGGTGGHMFPAQAFSQEMLARGWRAALVSDARGLRYAGGFPGAMARHALRAQSVSHGGILARIAAPFALARGVWGALRLFRADRPALVAGFGGYPAFPALAAARLLGIPIILHEQNGVIGRVNRLFARFGAPLACGIWPVRRAPNGAKTQFVGNPVREAALTAAQTPYPDDEQGLKLLVFGGSQGAQVFSKVVPAAAALLPEDLRARLSVTHQARDEDAATARAGYAEAGVSAEISGFFEDMPRRIALSHLVIARAGASSVAELAVIGRPSILCPYPSAMDDHQSANARMLVSAGGAITMAQPDFTASALAAQLAALLGDPAARLRMAQAARAAAAPEAAAALADFALAAARPKTRPEKGSSV